MKKFLLLSLFAISSTIIFAQTIAFHENFELPSLADSVTADTGITGGNLWSVSSNLASEGIRSDSCQISLSDTSYLTTNTFSTLGNSNVFLKFSHICKIEFFDVAEIQVSNNNGATWTKLTGTQYLGTGNFGNIGNKFTSTSYLDWLPANNNAIPTNAWWKAEQFDISTLVGNSAQVKIRFMLRDANNTGSGGNYGWLIDDIEVLAAFSELIPPTITLVNPILNDSVYNLGPFDVYADITDASGIDTAMLVYTRNNGTPDTVGMVNTTGNTYFGRIDTIPSYTLGDTTCYYIYAVDNSLAANSAKLPTIGCNQFVIYTSPPPPGCGSPITTFPLIENFDAVPNGGTSCSSVCSVPSGWTNVTESSNGTDWGARSGSTSSSSTGPSSDHTSGSGKYMYTETSSCYYKTAILLTPCLNLNILSAPKLDFYYHMYGSSMGSLYVDIWQGGQWVLGIWSKTGNQGNSWHKAEINLTPYKCITQIRFRGVTGSSYTSDMAIDDVKIYVPPANDAGITEIEAPASPALVGNQNVNVKLMNFGSANLTQATINWSVDGTLKTPFSWTGNVAPGTALSQVNIGQHNFTAGVSTVKAWTSSPNGTTDPNAYNDTTEQSIIVCSSILNGIYTIGSDTSDDFNSISDAITNMYGCGINGNVIFNIDSGTYNEQVLINPIPGASDTSTITFQSATGNYSDVIITNSGAYTIKFNGADYIKFKNVTIKTTSTGTAQVVHFDAGACHNEISNNMIIGRTVTSSSNSYATIYNASGSPKDEYNVIKNNIIKNGSYGLYCYGQSSSSSYLEKDNVIEGNDISGYYYYGIYAYYQDGIKINYNNIHDGHTSGQYYHIYMRYCDNDFEIVGNRIDFQKGYGIYMYYCDATSANRALIANNMISQHNQNTTAYGMYIRYPKYYDVVYNSFNITSSSSSGYGLYFYNSSSSYTGHNIKNNNFVNTGSGYAAYIYNNSYMTSADYNNYYSPTGNFVYWQGSRSNLTALKSAYTNRNVHSVSTDPMFVSSSDLHTISTILNSGATPFSAINDDFDGDLRDTVSPDIGADEFLLIPHDAGIYELVSPLSPCPSDTSNIIVNLKNYGTDTLFTATVNWAINDTIKTPYYFNDTLLVGQMKSLTIGQYVFIPGINYKIESWSSNPNGPPDGNPSNDSISVFPIKTSMASTTYTIGGTGADYPNFSSAVNDLNSVGICGPVIFNVNPGTYNEQITLNEILGTSATNTIIFKSTSGDSTSVILTDTNSITLHLNGTDYCTFKNITIANNSSLTTAHAIQVSNNATHNTISNNIILGKATTSTSTNFATIYSPQSGGNDEYNSIINNVIKYGSEGIFWYGQSNSAGMQEVGNIFNNNIVQDCYYMGIRTHYQNAVEINYNKITLNSSYSTLYGIYSYQSSNNCQHNYNIIDVTGPSTVYGIDGYYNSYYNQKGGVQYNNNKIYITAGSTTYGIYSYYNDDSLRILKNDIQIFNTGSGTVYGIYAYYSDGSTNARGLTANNFVSIKNGTGTHYGIRIYRCYRQNIYNNSVNLTAGNTSSYAMYLYDYAQNNIVNNIFSNSNGGYAMYIRYSNDVDNCNYNNYYTTGSNFAYWQGTRSSLYSLQTYNNKNSNSVSVLPNFATSTDLHINSLLLDSAGTILSEVTDDIDGDLRNTIKPDIGADEFVILSDDAGILALASPVAPCPGDTSNIIVTLKNYGTDTLFTATINWKLNNVLQTPVNFNDTILQFQSKNVLLGTYIFNQGTNYNLEFWSSNPNGPPDANTSNDTLIILNFQTSLPSSTYTIGPDLTDDYNSFTAAVSDLNTYGVCGPVVFNVDTGTYNEQISIQEITGSSAINTITFQSATNDSTSVILTNNGNYTVELDGSDYVTFKNMTIENNSLGTISHAIIVSNAATHNTFSNNIILGKTVTSTSTDYAVIYSPQAGGNDEYNSIINNLIKNGSEGIFWYGQGNSSGMQEAGNIFNNNIVQDCYYMGIRSHYQNAAQLNNNQITLNTAVSTSYGIYSYQSSNNCQHNNNIINITSTASVYGIDGYYNSYYNQKGGVQYNNNQINISAANTIYGIYAYYNDDSLRILKNKIVINSTGSGAVYGIYSYYSDGSNNAYGLTANNFVAINSGTGTHNGIRTYRCYRQNIFYNSVNLTAGNTSSYAMYLYDYADNNIKNNIFTNSNNGYALYVYNSNDVDSCNYNNYYTTGSNFAYWQGSRSSLAALQSYNGKDNHSKNTNPVFYAPYNLHVLSGSINNKGNSILEVTDDIDDEPRDSLTPDIGADEFIPLGKEASLMSLSGIDNGCGLDSVQITIEILNNGIDTIAGSLIASYQNLINSSVTNEAVNDSILPGDTLTYTFNNWANVMATSDSMFYFKVWIALNGDPVAYNDTLQDSLFNGLVPPSPVVSDTSIPYGNFVTLTAISPDTIYWFEYDTSTVVLAGGPTYTTPPLYDTTTYWVQSQSGGGAAIVTVGTGTLTNGSSSYPTPYGNWYDGNKNQFLIRASELTSAGMGAGNIQSLAFDVANVNSCPSLTNFTVKIKNTTTNSLSSSWQSGLTQVYTNSSHQPVNGWNTYIFTTPFAWDGTSNLLVETCFNNTNYVSNGCASVRQTNTSYNSTHEYHADNPTVCTSPSSGSTYTKRPNIKFDAIGTGGTGCPSAKTPITVNVGGIPAGDVGILSISTPEGCGLDSLTPVTIEILNQGYDTVTGNLSASYKIDNNPYITPENIPDTILPNDTIFYTFATPADLTALVNDTIFKITAYVNLLGDPNHQNDTLSKDSIESLYTPNDPIVSDTTIPYASFVTLTAISQDSLSWFADDTTSIELATGTTYTTPLLYDTTTYWIQAGGGFGNLDSVHPSTYSSTYTSTSGLRGYHFQAPVDFTITGLRVPTNVGTDPQSVEVLKFATAPSGSTAPHTVLFHAAMVPGSGYIACNIPILMGDYISINGSRGTGTHKNNYASSSPISIYGINTIIGRSWSNSASLYNSPTPSGTVTRLVGGSISQVDFLYGNPGNGCASNRVSLNVNVLPPPPYDPGISLITTPEGCGLDSMTPVTIDIYNIGTDTIKTGLTASFKVDNHPFITPETVPDTIPPGDTITYTFNTPAIMKALVNDTIFKITAYVNIANDPNHQNDTLYKDSIDSYYTPADPIVTSPINIPYSSPATLTAISQDSLYWYENLLDTVEIATGSTYITPLLFDTTTYYVEAKAGASGIFTVGTGTTTNGSSSYPSPYANYYWGAKHQFLIRASELVALGMTAGTVESIAFDVANVNSCPPLANFYMKIGNTNVSSLSNTWLSGLTNVYTAASYSTTTGWNTHNFSSPFVWDGTSNIVIETCFNNSSWVSGGNASVRRSNTSYTSTHVYRTDNASVCSSNSTTYTYSYRPNMKISIIGGGCPTNRIPVVVNVGAPPPIDAGVYDIINPNVSTPSGVPTPIIVRIKNYGLNPLTSAVVNWSVNGVTKPTFAWTGAPLLTDSISQPITIYTDTFAGGVYDMKSWTTLPNGVADPSNYNDTAYASFNSCLSGSYSLGSPTSDFHTFADALTAIDSAGICGHVIFNIDSGTYNVQLNITQKAGVGPTSTVTFQSATGDSTDVVLTSSGSYTIKLSGADYFKFKHLTIKTTSAGTAQIVQFDAGANHNEFSNNVIIGRIVTSTSSSYSVIYNHSGSPKDEYNLIKNNVIKYGSYGIYFYGQSSSSSYLEKGNVIEGNHIMESYYYGIYAYYQDSIYIIGNKFTNNVNYSNSQAQIYMRYCDNNFKVVGNTINYIRGYGIYMYYCDGTSSKRGLIANNMISQHTGNSTSYGIYARYPKYTDVYYNTIKVKSTSSSSYGFYWYNSSSSYGYHNITNNIFVNEGSGYAAYVYRNSYLTSADYNDFYSPTGNFVYWQGSRSSLAALKAAYSNRNQHSVSVDPGFATPTELHINSVDLNAAATPIAIITDDIDGQTRHATTPDIGADEFTPSPTDAGVYSIDFPVTPVLAGNKPVKITLRNFGTDTLTSVTIAWKVNSTLQTSYNWTGQLLTGQTDTMTIGNYNFVAGSCNLKAWTTSPNNAVDGFPYNDTSEVNLITCAGFLSGVYTIGGTNPDFATIDGAVQALNICGIDSLVIFNIASGVYNDQISLSQIPGASTSNTVTFQSATGDSTDVTITSSGAYTIKLNGADYVKFKKITIATSSTGTAQVIHFDAGANHNEFSNNVIIGRTTTSTSNAYATIYNASGSPKDEYNIIKNNVIKNGSYGIYWYGQSSSSSYLEKDNVIEGNDISGYYYNAIYAYYQDGIKINYNNIHNGSSGQNYHIYMRYCDNDFEIVGNRIDFEKGYGIYMYYCDGTSSNRALIANNMISQHTQNSTAYGLYVRYPKYYDFVYNTISITSTSSSGYGLYFYNSSSSYTGHNITNNNFVNTGGGYAAYIYRNSYLTSADYNNYYAPTGNFVYWQGSQTNLTALKAAYTNRNIHSVSDDPMFVSTTDLHSNSSVLNAGATPLTIISDDYDGDIRDSITPDIGADEFVPLALNIGPIAIVQPTVNYSSVGGVITVEATIKNFGSDTLYSFNLGYIAGNLPPTTAVCTDTLYPGGTTDYQFTSTFAAVSGQINLCVYTDLTNDGDSLNDTLCMTFTGVPLIPVAWSDNFDTIPNFWVSFDGNMEWERGIPLASKINNAHSNPNVWATNLNGQYSGGNDDNLYSPFFDFSQAEGATLKFWHWIEAQSNDGGNVQVSIDGGISWSVVGTISPNWYTSTAGGNYCWSGSSSGWQLASFNLDTFDFHPTPVQFRFHFFSTTTVNDDGWAIDDFSISLPLLPKDAGITDIITPGNNTTIGDNITVQVTIKNYGTDILDSIPVNYAVKGQTPTTEFWTGSLASGASTNYTFTTPYYGPNSMYQLCAWTSLMNDTYFDNDSAFKNISVTAAAIDVGFTAFIKPDSITPIGMVTVEATIKNFGTNTITSIPVEYDINGMNPTQGTWTGTLLPNATENYTFSTNYFSPIGTYVLCAYTKLSGDADSTNNKVCKSVITGINEYDDSKFMLFQNIPNPTKGITTIDYIVPKAGKIKFELSNLIGQIMYFENKNVLSGKHQIDLDINSLPNGIYYYSILFEGKRLVKKMIKN